MYISFRQSTTRREPVLECGRCGALVTDTGLHADWHKALEGGHGAVLSEDQAVEHGLVPDPERTAPPTSSEVAREEERLRRITGRRSLYPFPAPVHAVPSVFMEAVYSYEQDRARSQELDASLRDLSERLDHEDGQQMVRARDDAAVAETPQTDCPDPSACPCVAADPCGCVTEPTDAGLGPQPLTDPLTGRRRTPE